MERLTQEAQIGPFASLRDKAEAKPRAFNDYDCFLAHARAVTALKAYEDICFDENGKERITVEELSALVKAREEGRVVAMPCRIGDTVFMCTRVFNGKDTVPMIGSRKIDRIEGNALNPIWMTSTEPFEMHFHPSEFGTTVFLTRAEAEAALSGGVQT